MEAYFNNLMKKINKSNHIRRKDIRFKGINELVSYALFIYYSGYITEDEFNFAMNKIEINPCMEMYVKERKLAVDNLLNNNELLNDFYLNALSSYNKYQMTPKEILHTKKNINDKFIEFLKYMNCYDLYQNMENKRRITYSSPVLGYSICVGNNRDSYIVINEKDNLYRYISLVHELAHAKENEILKDHKGYFDLSPTNEILSITFNRIFLEYLKENSALTRDEINLVKNNFEINCRRYIEYTILITIAVRSKIFTIDDFDINMYVDNSTITRKLTDHNYSIGSILSLSFLDMWRKSDRAFISDIPNVLFYLNKMKFDELIDLFRKHDCIEKELDKVFVKK